ncbi:kinesin-domain-containing protein [Gymnopus androsaceus JB14]|uniref:Kinesin-domain-containing protein n=1 Tax=Gymnopus androsaceus JB14 TaxID=1447944 RepID=A0A6A4H931_9AGAR|nr:kinesin-domain-containing protein [Gymnopus androsaceus JB14]
MFAVRIVARLRPPLPGEVCDDGVRVVSHRKVDKENAEPNKSANNSGPGIIVTKEGSSQHYPFHSAYGPDDSTTQTLFIHDMLPLVDQVFSGQTVTVFAYGVTSSGKTYTMQGNGLDDRGVIGLVVDEIFKRLGAAGGTLSMSYLELYLDAPYDLLVPPRTTSSHSGAPPLSFGTSIHLPALSTHHIESPEAFRSLYAQAAGNRSTGATLLNSSSSRSHAVLTLYLTLANAVVGKLHLLDLAGSENNNLTGNNPSRMKESSAINTSLTALGLVVSALNDNAKAISKAASKGEDPKLKLIPYRSSSLTRLLSDALGGSSLALLIVCLAPGTKFRSDLVRSVG